MKQYLISFLLCVFTWSLCAQKVISKQFQAENISTITIDGNTMFKIAVFSKETAVIQMEFKVEGENNEQIVLLANQAQDTLFISSAYQPLFNKPDDKLSAHKAISIELSVTIPEGLDVNVTSDIASVDVEGLYNYMLVELLNGHFTAHQYQGNLLVNTLRGNISVETNFAELNAYTKNGTLIKPKLDSGEKHISLNSINGSITVTKTQ